MSDNEFAFVNMTGTAAYDWHSVGVHRVLDDVPRLPQAAQRLNNAAALRRNEMRIDVEYLNLDAASYRQLADDSRKDDGSVDGDDIRRAVLDIVADRGKMQNPVTGSGGMLLGRVAEVGPECPLGLRMGDHVATLVSLSLTPLAILDELDRWDGRSERVPLTGHAIVFGRSIVARIPVDFEPESALMIMDVCGAPALVRRVLEQRAALRARPSDGGATVCVIGASGKSGSLSLAAAAESGASHLIGVVPDEEEAAILRAAGLADRICVVDGRDPIKLAEEVARAGGPADLTVVCADVPGCEQPAILATAPGGTIVYFSMATDFAAAALGAEGLAADVTMLIGNGYTPGHVDYAFELVRRVSGLRQLFEVRRMKA